MNNPLRYTDPSGWVVLSNGHKVGMDFNDWGVSNSAELYMPGSSGHWSDGIRGQYGNSILGDQKSYDKMYGPGAWEIAQSLASNPATRNQWRQGMISIEQVRRNGGYWTTTTTTLGNQLPVYDGAGRIIVVNLPATEVFKKWNPVAGQSGGDGNIFAQTYSHFQTGGGDPLNVSTSSLDFSGVTQKNLVYNSKRLSKNSNFV